MKSMIPKIEFVYSWVYDRKWREEWKRSRKKHIKKYPSERDILRYRINVQRLWNKEGPRILHFLSKSTGLKWKEKKIRCYLVGVCYPFSDPLTMPLYRKDILWFLDTLTHELIHQILFQNEKEIERAWRYFAHTYKNETLTTRIHIPIHALHQHLYLTLFTRARLQRELRIMSHYPDYKRSWEIVQREGYKKILNELKKRI